MRDFTTTTLENFEGELRADVLGEVDQVLARAEAAARRGHWVAGYVSYEAAPAFDSGLRVRPRDDDRAEHVPLAWFGIFRAATTSGLSLPRHRRVATQTPWTSRIHEEDYVKKVQSILDEIEVGTVYQVNLTTTLVRKGSVDARAIYRQLLIAQQPTYGSLIELEDAAIVSASPELFVDWDGTVLRSRPMKGTARRGRYRKEDKARADALVNSPKELAENVMIVDLIRNDMGKVAEIGTVATTELQTLEAYPNVWQLASEVQCQTKADVELVDIFRAMFPCGSVTGAPKQSAMQIIERLEVNERGVYCGALGLLQPVNGGLRARFSVAIRTAVVANTEARYGSGGGVVAASDPEHEFCEMVLKAEMLSAEPARPFRLLETFGYAADVLEETLRAHLGRMRSSAAFFGFRCPSDLEARVISRLGTSDERSRIRLLLSRSGEIEVQRGAMPLSRTTPVRLAIDDEPVCSESTMLFHKTTLRHPYDRRRRKFPRADDVVMINERGECTETTIASIAARVSGTWVTPPLSSGCLPGIGRARLIDEGVLVEAVLRPEDLRGATELAVVNSLRGWQCATLLDSEESSSGGPSVASLDMSARI
ncbi:MAG TPA: bifunctional anthranilate synthase component I family protein/class IV aminotransferase [Acidimicrobiales bacterium]